MVTQTVRMPVRCASLCVVWCACGPRGYLKGWNVSRSCSGPRATAAAPPHAAFLVCVARRPSAQMLARHSLRAVQQISRNLSVRALSTTMATQKVVMRGTTAASAVDVGHRVESDTMGKINVPNDVYWFVPRRGARAMMRACPRAPQVAPARSQPRPAGPRAPRLHTAFGLLRPLVSCRVSPAPGRRAAPAHDVEPSRHSRSRAH